MEVERIETAPLPGICVSRSRESQRGIGLLHGGDDGAECVIGRSIL